MSKLRIIGLCLLLMVQFAAAESSVLDWAYHDDDDEDDDRTTEIVPGETFHFLANTTTNIGKGDTITLYVLLPHLKDNDKDNVLDVRWWNGKETNWVSAVWQKDVLLGKKTRAGQFHALPMRGEKMVDLWKADISPKFTRPGDNYYFFRYRVKNDGVQESVHYVVRSDPYHDNNLGQSWSPLSETYGRDWKITIAP